MINAAEGFPAAMSGKERSKSRLTLALAVIGQTNAAVYDGSWAEWGQDNGLPMETGLGKRGWRWARDEFAVGTLFYAAGHATRRSKSACQSSSGAIL